MGSYFFNQEGKGTNEEIMEQNQESGEEVLDES